MSQKNHVRLIAALAFIGMMGPMSIDAYLPAMPAMAEGLSASIGAVQWTIAVYLIGIALFPLVFAPLSDAHGRRVVLRVGLLLYAAASLGCAFAPSIEALIALRVLQATCGGTVMVVTRATLADRFRGDELSRAISYLMILFTAAPVFAPAIGAQILEFAGWRAVFGLLTAFGVVAFLVTLTLEETLPPERRRPYRPRDIAATYSAAMTSRAALGYLVVTSFSAVTFFAMLSSSAFIYIEHFGVSPVTFSVIFGGISATALIGNFINARLVMRRGYPAMLRGASFTVLALAAVMAVLAATNLGGLWGVLGVMVCLMICFHILNASVTAGIMDVLGEKAGAAAAALAFWRFLGGALGAAGVGAFGDTHPWTFALMLGVGAVGMVAGLPLTRR